MTPQGQELWQRHRSHLRLQWWAYLLLAVISTAIFIWAFQTRDPYIFAILLLIPLLALRKAWRIDREIRNVEPIIHTKEIS